MKVEKHNNFVGAKGLCPCCGTIVILEESDNNMIFNYGEYVFNSRIADWIEAWFVHCPNCKNNVKCVKI